MKKRVVFNLKFAPGDSLVFTTVLRDLYLSCPSEYEVDVHNYYPEIFKNNPYITSINDDTVYCYKKIKHEDILCKRMNGNHYSKIFNQIVSETLKVKIQQNSIYPELYLSKEEESEEILDRLKIEKPFWIINSSFKIDMPLKSWIPYRWVELIEELQMRNVNLVQTGSNTEIYEELSNIKSVIGKTENIRDFISLCYHSSGIITHTSFPVHVAAALNKPCVVLNFGRENPWYSCYPNQQVLHTVGLLDCCSVNGCFKKQRNECIYPVGKLKYPLCVNLVSVNDALRSVMKYESNKILGD